MVNLGSLSLLGPRDVTVDSTGDLYIADFFNSRVVAVLPGQQSLSFANTGTGQTSADSPQTVSILNIGNEPLNMTALSTMTTGQTAGSFNLNGSGTTCTSSTSLAAGESCALGVEFLPVSAGALTGTVNIADNNLNASAVQQISLSGTGVGFYATLALNAYSQTVTYGTPVAITATLSGSNGVPTGNVTYSIDGGIAADAPLISGATSSTAQIALPTLHGRTTHRVAVNYPGDAYYVEPTISQTFVLTVNSVATDTTLSAPSTATAGQSVRLTATVLAGTTPVTSGTVTFFSGTTSIGAATLDSNGQAVLTTTQLPAGTDSITASYLGTMDYATSTTTAASTIVVSAVVTPSYSMTASPTSMSVAQGKTGVTMLTLTPVSSYSGTLTLSCGNLPSYATCVFYQGGVVNNTVTMSGDGKAIAVTLNIQTNVATAARLNALPGMRPGSPQHPSTPLLPALAFWFPGGVAWLAAMGRKRKRSSKMRQGLRILLLALMTGALAVGFSGCSSNATTVTPVGTSTITVTAAPSAGSIQSQASQTLSLALTVTQ